MSTSDELESSLNPIAALARKAEELGLDLQPPIDPLFGTNVYQGGDASKNFTPEQVDAMLRAAHPRE